VELVIARLGDIRHLRAGVLSVLAGVSVGDDVGFGNIIGSQQQIGSSAVVQAQERIVEVLAVNRKQIRRAGQAVG